MALDPRKEQQFIQQARQQGFSDQQIQQVLETKRQQSPQQQTPAKKGLGRRLGEFFLPATTDILTQEVAPIFRGEKPRVARKRAELAKQPFFQGRAKDMGQAVQRLKSIVGSDAETIRNAIASGVELGSFFGGSGSTLKQAAGAGALRGGAIGVTSPEAKGVGQALARGATGAGFGAGAGAAAFGISERLGGGARSAGESLRRGVVSPKVPATPNFVQREQQIVQGLRQAGIKGTARQQASQLPGALGKITGQIDDFFGKNTNKFSTAQIVNQLDEALELAPAFVDDPAHQKASETAKALLVKQANKGGLGIEMSGKDLFQFKQTLGKQLSKAFTKIQKGTPLNAKEETFMTVWSSMDDVIAKAFPAIKDKTIQQSMLIAAAPGLKSSAEKPLVSFGIGRGGVNLPFIRPVAQFLQDLTGRALESVGEISTGGAVPTAAQILGGRLGSAVGGVFGADNAQPQSQPQPQPQPALDALQQRTGVTTDGAQVQQPQVQAAQQQLQPQLPPGILQGIQSGQLVQQGGQITTPDGAARFDPQQNTFVAVAPTQQNGGGITQDLLRQEATKALQSGDLNRFKQIEAIAKSDVLFPEGEAEKKPLSAGQIEDVNLAKSGIRGVARLEEILEVDPNTGIPANLDPLSKQLVPGKFFSRAFDSALFNAVNAKLRIESGAAVPETEVRRFMKAAGPIFGDSPEVVKSKLDQLKFELNNTLLQESARPAAEDILQQRLGGGF